MAYITRYRDNWRAQVEKNGVRASRVFPTKREAQAWALEVEAQARLKSRGFQTFQDAATKYIKEVSAKKDGHAWETRRIKTFVERFGTKTMGELDSPDMAAWRDSRLEKVTASTVVREANLLKHIFHTARDEWRWIEHDPFRGVKLPSENQPRHQRWTWTLIKRVLRAGQNSGQKTQEVAVAFHIALRTGMRLQEVLMAPAGFDKRRQVVVLPKTKTEGRTEVPVGRIAAKLLDRPAFVVNANEASTLFRKLTKSLLIDGLTFHDSRATALTLLSKKVDVMTLAKVSRHKDLSLLMNTYYRERAEDIARRL